MRRATLRGRVLRGAVFQATRHPFSNGLLVLACLGSIGSCGRAERDEPATQGHVGGGDAPIGGGGESGGGDAGRSNATGGIVLAVAGQPSEPAPPKPTKPTGSCGVDDRPGAPCEKPSCGSSRCGVAFHLTCHEGVWVLEKPSAAFELTCAAEDEFSYGLPDLTSARCCGEQRPRAEGSCELCPTEAPENGDACTLPDDCSPRVLDCFYSCCCYGTTTWAQCDGERWHVATDCSGK
jgi:hypothetical protein